MSDIDFIVEKERNKLILEVVNKIEWIRVTFRDNLGYTAVSLMNDLWDYLRELEERLK